jgi:hypothetical protein
MTERVYDLERLVDSLGRDMTDRINELEKLVDFMERRQIARMRVSDIEIARAEPVTTGIEAAAQEQESVQTLKIQEPSLCKCGHDLDTEHNQLGCLFGCSEVLCRSEEDQHE